jgi:hypothetical protein
MLKINGNATFLGCSLTSNTIPGKKTLVTTKANTILVHTIQQFAPGTCMKRYHFKNYQELASLAL